MYGFSHICFFLLILLSMNAASSPLKDKLWLPVSYQAHFVRLFEAAEKVIGLDECYYFLNGTLDEKRSTKNKPVFLFRCRDAEKQTFAILVDASDLTVTQIRDVWQATRERELQAEKQRKLRQRLADRDRYWAVCEAAFKEKTKTFSQVEIKTPFPLKPEITEEGYFIYLIEFQTLSLNKNVLTYLATAEIEHLHECKLSIRPT